MSIATGPGARERFTRDLTVWLVVTMVVACLTLPSAPMGSVQAIWHWLRWPMVIGAVAVGIKLTIEGRRR